MRKLYRILAVVFVIVAAAAMGLDYCAFHGSLALGRIAGGAAIGILDGIAGLFTGRDGFTNLAFVAIIALGLIALVAAVAYRFIAG